MTSDSLSFQEIIHGSTEYEQALALREQVLRAPLGLTLSAADTQHEDQQFHFGLFDETMLIACVSAISTSPRKIKIRQMAVAPSHQKQGYGAQLLTYTEAILTQRGFIEFVLHARMSAVAFYQHCGYITIGNEFLELNIPHMKMRKDKSQDVQTS